MLGMLVVSHGRLAEELVNATRTIVEQVEGLEAVSFGWNDDVDVARRSLQEALARVDRGQGVLILTDMFGGTPTNLAVSLQEEGHVEIVTGVNLPMLIKFADLRGDLTLEDAAALVAEQGRESIHVASHLLEVPQTTDTESADG